MSIFSKSKKKDYPAEKPPPEEFVEKLNGPEFSEDSNLSSDTDVPSPSHNRRSLDGTHGNDEVRGRRSTDRIRLVINKILSGQNMGEILFSLTDELKTLFNCQAVSVYAIDRDKRQ